MQHLAQMQASFSKQKQLFPITNTKRFRTQVNCFAFKKKDFCAELFLRNSNLGALYFGPFLFSVPRRKMG